MPPLVALSAAIGLLGAVATWVFLSAGSILIWACFIGWGCFFHSGGTIDALKKTVICNTVGAVFAVASGLIILSTPLTQALGLPLAAALLVGIFAAVLCLLAYVEILSVIPASFYGFAATFAFLLQTPQKLAVAKLTAFNLDNALIVVPLSMAIGAGFGLLSGKLSGLLQAKPAHA